MKPYALSEIREMCLMAGAVKQNLLVGAHSKIVRQWGLSFLGTRYRETIKFMFAERNKLLDWMSRES